MRAGSKLSILGLFVGLLACGTPASAQTQVTASSLAELRTYAAMDSVNVTLAPGEYWLGGDGSNPTFLEFSGSDSTYDLSGAQIKMDTRELAGYGNSQGVRPITVTGSSNFIAGLDFSGHDLGLDTDPNARRYADRSAVYLQVTGNDNQLQDTTLLVRGSSPYGYGDVFGKGARFPESGLPVEEGGFAFLSHNKTSSFLVTGGATNTVVDNLDLTSQAYGHGFFVQGGATNTTIRNSTITGELVPGNNAIAHPEYQEYAAGADGILGTPDDGGTRSGTPLPENIYLSAQEDGIRMYTGTTGLTVENTVVTNFRSGVHSTFANGTVTIDNVEAYGTENAFVPGSNTTITNSKGDITNGPLVYVQYNGKSNTTIDVELVGDVPVGVDWAVAYVNGSNFDVTVRSDLPEGLLPEDSVVRLGQTWFNNWRDQLRPTNPEEGDPGPFTNSTFTNLTNEYAVLGNLATGNTGFSQAGVVTNGKENHYDGLSVILSGTHVVLTDAAGLGNNGTEQDGSLESNASVVFAGATLEIQPGIRVEDEKLTITGHGIDGRGALYSDGDTGTGTRFGSSNASDESTIFLDGNASIGVGVAGNHLVVGRIQGAGNFTKRGPGKLTVGKSSALAGDMTVAEGEMIVRSGVANNGLTVMAGASIGQIANGGVFTSDTVFLFGEMDVNARTDDNSLSATVGPLFGSGVIEASNGETNQASTLTIDTPTGGGFFVGRIEDNVDLVKAGAGSQALSGSNTYTGTTTVRGGLLQVEGTHIGGGGYMVEAGGTLSGNGDIGSAVLVEAGGVLAPGASAGELTVQRVELQPGSTLEIELESSTVHDLLSVDDLVLGGDLVVTLIGSSFTPGAGDVFTVAVADSLSGAFENVDNGARLDTLGGEGSFLVSYSEAFDTLTLSDFALTGLAGDFNADGTVDSADYSVWRDGLGTTYTPADYDTWVSNFGATAATTSVSVPEPTAGILVSLAAGCWLYRRAPIRRFSV